MDIKILAPSLCVKKITDIDFVSLKNKRIKAIFLDLDNTIIPWKEKKIESEVIDFINNLKKHNFKICIVSNSIIRIKRVKEIAKILDVPYQTNSFKPYPKTFHNAAKITSIPLKQTAIIGDQIFTDILGGNLCGLYTILVEPLSKEEFFTTKIMRKIEKFFKKT